MICGIYKITSPSGSIYIGQSINIEKRFDYYRKLNASIVNQRKLYNSFLKYGTDNHVFEVVQECERHELNELEVMYIKRYNTFNSKHGLNLRSGGEKPITSEETRIRSRIRSSESAKKRKYTKEGLMRLSAQRKGRKHSQATKEKMRLSSLGKNTHNKNCIKVFQYNAQGEKLREFHSITEAAKNTGAFVANICRALNTNYKSVGFLWRTN